MAKLLYASTKNSDLLYAVKVEIPDALFYIHTGKKEYEFLDHRELGVFQEHNHNPNIEVVLLNPLLAEAAKLPGKTSGVNKLAKLLVDKYQLAQPLEVSKTLPLDMADYLRSEGVILQVKHPFLPERLHKQTTEVEAIHESLHRTHAAFQRIEDILHESVITGDEILYQDEPLTSEHLKAEVERTMLEHDLLNVEGIIISCGFHAAIPHHRGAGKLRPNQTIICDIFPRHRASGYFADMTRTYVKGEVTPEIKKMYEAVSLAQRSAIQAIRPGKLGKEIHQVCVKTFDQAGFEFFR